jgi:HTH-type transcriptional regulator / antitoxin HipB
MKTVGNSKELGAVIRAVRKGLGVTQKDLAMTAGTGLRFIVELERGKPTARMEGVFKVLQALGLSLQMELPIQDVGGPRNE